MAKIKYLSWSNIPFELRERQYNVDPQTANQIIIKKPLIIDEIITNKVIKETQELIQIFGKSIQTAISRK